MKHESDRILAELGLTGMNPGVSTGREWQETGGRELPSSSPLDGAELARVQCARREEYDLLVDRAGEAFRQWREVPAPRRGEVVRRIGLALREHQEELGTLVSLEMGKCLREGLGEVQEMIDIADFAVGQSRQLYGFTMPSERREHRLFDHYHPYGVVGLITAFNFPVAVYAWNAMIAAVCGDVVIWKPSSKTPLTAIAVQKLIGRVLEDEPRVPEGVFNLLVGSSADLGDVFCDDPRVPLVSVTGSTRVGRRVAEKTAARLGRTILELGGNNALIVTAKADLEAAVRAILFGAVGTAGQRCTTTRRVIAQDGIYEELKKRLLRAYGQVAERIGDPLDDRVLVGPLVDTGAVADFQGALARLRGQGGRVLFGGQVLGGRGYETGTYVVPALCEAENHFPVVQEETFAPILYLLRYGDLEDALAAHNGVPQGLSSSIFTDSIGEALRFLGPAGSDCGMANVNAGTSGAEIGGAFGGEKETGGGRESGSDAWKAYMRRQTSVINYGGGMELAQGIDFDL